MNIWAIFLVCAWVGHKPVEGPPVMDYRAVQAGKSFAVYRCARCHVVYWQEIEK